MTFCFGLHLILWGKLGVERREDFFLGLRLILRGKLNVEKREDLFFGLHRNFQWKRKQKIAPPPFQISGHAPELRSTFGIANMLRSKFGFCSNAVKHCLFRTFCSVMYGLNLWCFYLKSYMNRITIAHNNAYKILFYTYHGK